MKQTLERSALLSSKLSNDSHLMLKDVKMVKTEAERMKKARQFRKFFNFSYKRQIKTTSCKSKKDLEAVKNGKENA